MITQHMHDGNWRRSTHCKWDQCAEIGQDEGVVLIRDTTDREGPALAARPAEWAAFLRRIRDGH